MEAMNSIAISTLNKARFSRFGKAQKIPTLDNEVIPNKRVQLGKVSVVINLNKNG